MVRQRLWTKAPACFFALIRSWLEVVISNYWIFFVLCKLGSVLIELMWHLDHMWQSVWPWDFCYSAEEGSLRFFVDQQIEFLLRLDMVYETTMMPYRSFSPHSIHIFRWIVMIIGEFSSSWFDWQKKKAKIFRLAFIYKSFVISMWWSVNPVWWSLKMFRVNKSAQFMDDYGWERIIKFKYNRFVVHVFCQILSRLKNWKSMIPPIGRSSTILVNKFNVWNKF